MSKQLFFAFLLGTALQAGTALAADGLGGPSTRGAGKTAGLSSPLEPVRSGDGSDIRVYARGVNRQYQENDKQPKILEDNLNRGVLYDSGSPVTYNVPPSQGRVGK